MSDEIAKAVTIRLRAETERTVSEAFQRVSGSAKTVQKDVDNMARGAGQGLAGMGVEGEKAAAKVGGGLKGLATDFKYADRGVKQLQMGMYGLASTAGILDERLSKAMMVGMTLHSLSLGVRGASGIMHGGAMGGIASAAGAALVPLGLAAAAIVGVGAAAVSASPKLQNTLGAALSNMTDRAKESLAAITALEEKLQESSFAKRLGGGTLEQEAEFARRQAIIGPMRDRAEGLHEQGRLEMEHGNAMRMFPDKPFHDPAGKFGDAQGRMSDLVHGPLVGQGDLSARIKAEQAAMRAAIDDVGSSPASERGLHEAKMTHGAAASKTETLRKQLADFERRQRLTTMQADAGELGSLPGRIKSAEAERRAATGAWFGPDDQETVARAKVRDLEQRQADLKKDESRRAKILGAAGQFEPTKHGEGEAIAEQLAAASQREIDAQVKLKEAVDSVNMSRRDTLVIIAKEAAESEKNLRKSLAQEESRLSSQRSKMGLMATDDPATLKALAELGEKAKAGGELSAAERAFMAPHGFTADTLEKYGLGQADKNDELLKRVGAAYGLDDRKKMIEGAIAFDVKLQQDLKIQVGQIQIGASKEAADALAKAILPAIQTAFEQVAKDLARKLQADAAATLQKGEAQRKANGD